MSILIEEIIGGFVPETAKEIKEAIDHCEHIIDDCEQTATDPEVDEFKKRPYRLLKRQATVAMAIMKKLQKS